MESEHFIGKVAQKAFIEKDGKLLLVRDARAEDATMWDLPGGRLHRGEVAKMGLAREIMEEMGVEVEVGNIVYSNQFIMMNPSQPPHLMLVYEAVLKDPEKPFTLDPVEIAEARWFAPGEVPAEKMYDSFREAAVARFKELEQ